MGIEKLKIGLWLDSYTVPAWIHHAVERMLGADCIEVGLVVIDRVAPRSPQPSFMFRLVRALDRRIFVRGPDACASKDLRVLLPGIPVVEVNAAQDVQPGEDPASPVESFRRAGLDILVTLGSRLPPGEVLSSVRYGVWSYRFGDPDTLSGQYTGYVETNREKPLTTAALWCLENGGKERVLYRSQIATYKLSSARNQNSILWFASSFLARQIRLLHRLGWQSFVAHVSRDDPLPVSPPPQAACAPGSLDALGGAIRQIGRGAAELFSRLRFKDFWYLLYDLGDLPSFEIKQYKKLIPPADRFWADPFVVRTEDQYHIFVEEYPYSRHKGHIAVLSMDDQGEVSGSSKVLDQSYHLSYPCVFQAGGNYYMVPESGANRTIDLYECELFPARWKHRLTLMEGVHAVDSTLFYHQQKWWLFTGIREKPGAYPDVELFLFSADTLFTRDWKPHPFNPVISDITCARPAGQLFVREGRLYRPSQNCLKNYGNSFNLSEILCLSETDYREKIVATVQPDWDPMVRATHTYNRVERLSVIDAYTRRSKFHQ